MVSVPERLSISISGKTSRRRCMENYVALLSMFMPMASTDFATNRM